MKTAKASTIVLFAFLYCTNLSAALPDKHEIRLTEMMEDYFTAVPFDDKTYPPYDYAQDHHLDEEQVHNFISNWARNNWKRIWKESVNRIEPNNLESTNDPDVANGKTLPVEFVENDSRLRSLSQNPMGVFENSPEPSPDELRIVRLLGLLAFGGELDVLPDQLLPYCNNLPATQQDLFIVRTSNIIIETMECGNGTFYGTSVDVWEPLIQSKNPMYRYLALNAISHSIPKHLQRYCSRQPSSTSSQIFYSSAKQKLRLYENYYDDECELVRLTLYGCLSRIPHAEAISYLNSEMERRWKEIPEELIEYRDVAVSESMSPFEPGYKTKKVPVDPFAIELITDSISSIEFWLERAKKITKSKIMNPNKPVESNKESCQ